MKYLLHGEETERLMFRLISSDEQPLWRAFFEDPSSHAHWQVHLESAEREVEKWYARQRERYTQGLGGMNALWEKPGGAFVGYCGLLVQQVDGVQELEIGYSLLGEFRNKGYATEAARLCRDVAFSKYQAGSVISIISLSNEPSANVARKNGMHIDKQSVYHDNVVNIFRIKRDQWEQIKSTHSSVRN